MVQRIFQEHALRHEEWPEVRNKKTDHLGMIL